MRGTVAKKARKIIYGRDFSPRFRQYVMLRTGQIIADTKRRDYQTLKRGYLNAS